LDREYDTGMSYKFVLVTLPNRAQYDVIKSVKRCFAGSGAWGLEVHRLGSEFEGKNHMEAIGFFL
jgi:hypothetical protein